MAYRAVILLFLICLFSMSTGAFAAVLTIEGYFSPVFSPDGKEVYFVERKTTGKVSGRPGIEFFTPPADVFISEDDISLKKINLQDGKITTLKQWPPSPVRSTHFQEYHGRIFKYLNSNLTFIDNGQLEYAIGLRAESAKEIFWVTRFWDKEKNELVEKDSWYGRSWAAGEDEWPILNDLEVIAVPGSESYPSALVLYNHVTSDIRVLLKNERFKSFSLEEAKRFSKRQQSEYTQGLRKASGTLKNKYGSDFLRIGEELRNLGYYPQPTTIVARLLTPADQSALKEKNKLMPLFSIEQAEMQSGIFSDIQKAISAPGKGIEKSIGSYTIHRDYSNSKQLNELLNTGVNLFYVKYNSLIYELHIEQGGSKKCMYSRSSQPDNIPCAPPEN